MKLWQKLTLITLAVVLIAAVRLFFVFKARQDPGVAGQHAEAARPLNQDDLAVVREFYWNSFTLAKQLEGASVWIKAGYTLPYYPYTAGRVEYDKRVGVLPAAQKLAITKIVKAVAPAKEDNRVPHGSRQYLAVFTLDGNPQTYAAPIGYAGGSDEKLYCDDLFYYDDPKKIYDNWPQSVWDAVEKHEPQVGMTENQTRMAVGIQMQSGSQGHASGEQGDRTVTYDAGGKKWVVTFAHGAATQVKQG